MKIKISHETANAIGISKMIKNCDTTSPTISSTYFRATGTESACEKNSNGVSPRKCDKIHKYHNKRIQASSRHDIAASNSNNKMCFKISNTIAGCETATAALNTSVRINRFLALSGFCSRRKADEFILAGKVKINGTTVVTPGVIIGPDDFVEVDGCTISTPPPPIYLLLNKPIHTVCTLRDPEGRQTVLDFLPPEIRRFRLFPVGRLDYFSEGLLLLTNDGDLTQRLTHPRYQHAKLYEVLVRGTVPSEALATMRKGMTIAGNDGSSIRLLPVKVQSDPLPSGNTILQLELHQGINRQIRKMCNVLDITILRLRRVALGCLKLGNLPPGKIRALTRKEIEDLRKMVGIEK